MTAAPIFDTDPDALNKLREKLADLEAQRGRITAYNKSCKAGVRAAKKAGTPPPRMAGDLSILDAEQKEELLNIARYTPYNIGDAGELPAYLGQNLGGNISRIRERIARLERSAARDAAVSS